MNSEMIGSAATAEELSNKAASRIRQDTTRISGFATVTLRGIVPEAITLAVRNRMSVVWGTADPRQMPFARRRPFRLQSGMPVISETAAFERGIRPVLDVLSDKAHAILQLRANAELQGPYRKIGRAHV